jgi:hypothetical protein
MSRFDGVLERSNKPVKTVPRDLSNRTPGKSAHPDYQKTTVYLSKHLHRDVKIACLKANPPLDMSDVVERQLTNWLKSQQSDS